MFKKGPTEKEKILKHLTEKEIKEQLYGFRAKEPQPAREEPVTVKPVVKKEAPKSIEKKEIRPKNLYIVIQIVLLAVFLILIWISLRQLIKAVSKLHNRPPAAAEQVYKKTVRKQFKN